MVDRILVGVNGSEGSRLALRWALSEAALHRAAVDAVTVWQSPYDTEREFDFSFPVDEAKMAAAAKERLDAAIVAVAGAAGQGASVEIEPLVLEGDPAATLCKRAAGATLLVVGSRGRSAVTSLLLGSVSAECAHHSVTPVVIIPPASRGAGTPPTEAEGRIVVGVDGSAGSSRALQWACHEATLRGATVEALTVGRGLAPDDLAEVAATPEATIQPVVLEGDPAEVLCRRAADAALLVVGGRGHHPLGGMLGSVSAKCARHSPRPLVIVPTGQAEPVSIPPAGA